MRNEFITLAAKAIPPKYRPFAKTIYTRASSFGFNFKCPFCKASLRQFLPYGANFPILKQLEVVGGGYRRNAECPICGSFDRDRLLLLYLLQKTDLFVRRYRLLHVAPEPALEKVIRQHSNIEYITADLLVENVMVKMDLTNIKFSGQSVDAIICNHVLEHILDDCKAMSELYRILKPSGWAVLQVPLSLLLESTYEDIAKTTEKEREEAFGQGDHVRIYAKDYKQRLESVGFDVDIFDWTRERGNFGGSENVFGLLKDERIYIARRM